MKKWSRETYWLVGGFFSWVIAPHLLAWAPAAKPGDNALEIDVVNLWVNRLIGDEQLPEDSSRNNNGTAKSWPQWLLDGKPSSTGRFTFSSWRLWKKTDPLQKSGLLALEENQPKASQGRFTQTNAIVGDE